MLPRETGCVGPFPTQNIPASATSAPIPPKFKIDHFKPTRKTIPNSPAATLDSSIPLVVLSNRLVTDPGPPWQSSPTPIQPLPPSSLTAKAESSRLNTPF